MGCDEAVLLSDRAFGGSDTLATGYTLALAARKIENCDLLLFGRHAVDADTGQTGPIVAEFLNLPQVTFAVSLEVEDGFAVCERLLDRAAETVRARLPALVTVCAEINKPRYPSPLGIMKSGRKPFFTWTHEDLGCDLSRTGKAGSPSVVGGIFEPERKKVETVLIAGDISEMAKQFVDILTERHLLQGGGCG
jgi:electron transfer flavoprotein beta subunit